MGVAIEAPIPERARREENGRHADDGREPREERCARRATTVHRPGERHDEEGLDRHHHGSPQGSR